MEESEFLQEFKIESKVFDRRTLFAIFKLLQKGLIKSVESLIKEGKESVVVSARNVEGRWFALKLYRVEFSDFKSRWKYLSADPRFARLRKNKWITVITWARREFKNLKIAFAAGVNCPEPIFVHQNVLMTSFIGEDGIPAERLLHSNLKNPNKVYREVVNGMVKMAKANLIHSDLSPYNILMLKVPFFIDFSQAVTEIHPLAEEFLQRDVKNINNFFLKKGATINENLFEKLRKEMEL